ncbi:TPA: hypothetical protein O2E99_000592 [Staphylococcus aureus]|uniref:hypothetical protein n=2 Tax=Staphylococcus TaxID=1279 RepID=UPI0006ABF3CC|nr:hypothetical protein [Staphylococcus aureus]KOQ01955.1 hypothetical protein ABW30_11435 [Staphylococcus aureus]KOQ02673.1 hypothetical protein ABW29_11525 [Staphylococcus aureus]KOQ10588.1 hypothetical protein ABW31_10155 [Staphylococcus aureus]MCT6532772.1 hypothetical protein [Staphylococcus aureus]MSS96287.1 hypothetical protein [Staphylococcus aureus]
MKRLLGLLLASTLVLGACGSDGNKKEESKKTETKKENKDKKKETKEKAEAKKENANQNNNNNNNQVNNENNTNVNNNQQTNNTSKQQVQKNLPATNNGQQAQPRDPNEPSYEEYLNAKRATEEMENNPDKNQHAGGGPGMSLTHPNQSYDSFRKEVGKARSEAIVVQQ